MQRRQIGAVQRTDVTPAPGVLSSDQLSCKICLARYDSQLRRPRIMGCNHTFCEPCVRDSLLPSNCDPNHENAGSHKLIQCPICRARTRLGQAGVRSLGVHSNIIDVISRLERDEARRQQHKRSTVIGYQSFPAGQLAGQEVVDAFGGHRVAAVKVVRLHPPPNQPDPEPEDDDDDDDDDADKDGDNAATDFDDVITNHGLGDDGLDEANIGYIVDPKFQEKLIQQSSIPTPTAVYVGRFGKTNDDPLQHRPGTFRSPLSIACSPTVDSRLVVVDKGPPSVVQVFAANGDCLSAFPLEGAHSACFVSAAEFATQQTAETLAVGTVRGVVLCDWGGNAEKLMPLGEVLAIAPFRRGFVAARRDHLIVCDRYKPTALTQTLRDIQISPGKLHQFRSIVDVATSADNRDICVLDAGTVFVIDATSRRLVATIGSTGSSPTAVTVDPTSGNVILADPETRQVALYGATDGRQVRCLVKTDADGAGVGRAAACVGVAVGPRVGSGVQILYVIVRNAELAEVRMYRM